MIPAGMRARLVSVVLLLLLLPVAPVAAEIYRWVDDQGNAHYTEGLDRIPERFRSRAVPLGLRNDPAPAVSQPGPRSRDAGPPGGTMIRYRPGERIMVDVRLNGRTSARLLLDTGADRTLINPRSLIAAGVQLHRAVARGEMQGVTGKDSVLYVVLDSLEIGDARVSRIPVAAYEMGSADTDGLLGRDFLDRFNLSIDASRGVVTLTPR
jgi:hypothetical protein